MKNKRAQMSLEDAPQIVLIVGLVFLIMATMAFIGQKYGDAIPDDLAVTVTGETGGFLNSTGYRLSNATADGFNSVSITAVRNATNNLIIQSANYTVNASGTIRNATAIVWQTVVINYTYEKQTVAGDVTVDLQENIADNTSIAGIVLTISLVGIVLATLIGIFLITRRGTRP